jgi:hypothetical protein
LVPGFEYDTDVDAALACCADHGLQVRTEVLPDAKVMTSRTSPVPYPGWPAVGRGRDERVPSVRSEGVIATSSQTVQPRRVVIAAPITLGYGSPRYLRLHRVLSDRGHRVLLVDLEEPPEYGRRLHRLPGVRRLTVRRRPARPDRLLQIRRAWECWRRRRERPDVLVAGTNALLADDWPGVQRRVIYFGEIESEWTAPSDLSQRQADAADAVIAPQEDRLELARGLYRRAGAHFLVYNAPLRCEMPPLPERKLPAGRPLRVLYQGQINDLSCAGALLDMAEHSGGRFPPPPGRAVAEALAPA